jgi:hypothetical protein
MRQISDFLDEIVEPRYDTNVIPAAGTTLLTFFANPVGQGVGVYQQAGGTNPKTLADTNMDLSGQLPAGYNFVVLGFRIAPSLDITPADAQFALNGAVFTFTIGSKPFLRIPARTIPAGQGVTGFAATTVAATTVNAATLGFPALSNGYSIARKPLMLAQTQNFQATLTWPGGVRAVTTADATSHLAGLPITVFLDGYLKRIVQ